MGRRIAKTRRHKKLKFVDPCYTGPPVTPKNKKALPNEPPVEEDHQDVPKSVLELINSKSIKNQNKFKKRKKKKVKAKDDFIIVKTDKMDARQRGMTKPLKSLPEQVAQGMNETQKQFLSRLQKMADVAIAEAKLEEKYDVNIINIDKSGTAQFLTGEKKTGTKKAEKRKKQRDKQKEKKKRKLENKETDFVKDNVTFGEVVMEPPQLVKPRYALQKKAGERNLMLKELLKEKELNTFGETKKQKQKNLSDNDKLTLEAERLRVVQLYRSMKNKKKLL